MLLALARTLHESRRGPGFREGPSSAFATRNLAGTFHLAGDVSVIVAEPALPMDWRGSEAHPIRLPLWNGKRPRSLALRTAVRWRSIVGVCGGRRSWRFRGTKTPMWKPRKAPQNFASRGEGTSRIARLKAYKRSKGNPRNPSVFLSFRADRRRGAVHTDGTPIVGGVGATSRLCAPRLPRRASARWYTACAGDSRRARHPRARRPPRFRARVPRGAPRAPSRGASDSPGAPPQ